MLNWLAKLLLVSSALSPVLGAVAVNQYSLGKPPSTWLPWLVVGLLLVFICWALLSYAARAAQKHTLKITQFEANDKEMLAFLLAYLLPLASAKDMLAGVHWMTTVYVLVIIMLVFTHARALHFNPMLGLLGYHFYSLKDGTGSSLLLISRQELRRAGVEVQTVRLAQDVYLQIGGKNAH